MKLQVRRFFYYKKVFRNFGFLYTPKIHKSSHMISHILNFFLFLSFRKISSERILFTIFKFFFRKIMVSVLSFCLLFLFSFLKKILTLFTCLFSKLLFAFCIILIYHFYIQKKYIYKKIFLKRELYQYLLILFIRIFFISIFFIRIFSSKSEIFIYLGIVFSLTTYLHSSKNT